MCLKHAELFDSVTEPNINVKGEVPFAVHDLDGASFLEMSFSYLTFLFNVPWLYLINIKKPFKFVR